MQKGDAMEVPCSDGLIDDVLVIILALVDLVPRKQQPSCVGNGALGCIHMASNSIGLE